MHTYLGTLWQTNKKLFVLACLFIAGAFLPSVIHFEITPFYDWRMYAWPMQPHSEYETCILYHDGKMYNRPHTWQDYSRMMIMYTMPHYLSIKETGDTLPFNTRTSHMALSAFKWNRRDNILHMTTADLDRYPDWLKKYTGYQLGAPPEEIRMERVKLAYRPDHRVVPVKRDLIFTR